MRALVLGILLVSACGDGSSPARGGIRDADGRVIVPRGVNLAGSHKNTPYTDTFTQPEYTRVRADWGMNAIRFLITWSAIEPAQGQFDDAYLDWVRERMAWAHDAGLSVILDMHQDVYGEGFGFDGAPRWTCPEANYAGFTPQQPWGANYADSHVIACFDHLWSDTTELTAAWRHVAERLADEPAVIGFDPINEPSWGSYAVSSFERDRLQPFYETTIVEVRKAAPHWIAFVEPANSRNLGFATSLGTFAAKNVVYGPHLYDVNAETSGQFDPTHAGALVDTVGEYQMEADRMGISLWIGEYGGHSEDPQIAAYMAADYDAAASAAAGTMYWAYDEGGGYSLLDAQGQENQPLVDSVVRPAPDRVAGTPTSWTYDPATRAFELHWKPDASIKAPTVILAPARVYPNGANVDCGGCTVEAVGNELHLTGGAGVARVTPR